MMMSSRWLRVATLVVALGASLVAYSAGAFSAQAPVTRVGDASVALGDDTARAVERVAYRQDVVRIGDVVVVDGVPRQPISDPDIERMWQIVDSIWPDSLDAELRQLSVIEEEPRGLVGVVHPAAGGGWILSLDLADIDDHELVVETIVHELSHVVTLGVDVFTFGAGDCGGARIALGCARAGSVLSEFAETFWPGDVASDSATDHVNEYAMTAAHEDLSETFTAWVFGWPLGGATVAAKVEVMAADPELANLAAELIVRIG
jgi:hypothetical protein